MASANRSLLTVILVVLASVSASLGQQKTKTPIKVDYCTLINSADAYDEKIVTVDALMIHSTIARVDGGDEFLYSNNCNNEDFFTVTDYSRVKDADFKRIYRFKKGLHAEKTFVLKVSITGRFETAKFPVFGHLSWTLHQLMVQRISSIVDVTGQQGYQQPDWKAQTLITGANSRLRTTNARMLRYLAGIDSAGTTNEVSNELTITGPSRRIFKLGEIRELQKELKVEPALPTEVTVLQIKFEKEHYVIWGTFVVGKEREVRVFTYETRFTRKGSDLQLVAAVLSSPNAQ